MFVIFFLRFKYGPPIIVLAGIVLMAVGAAANRPPATGIVGVALAVIAAAVGITGKPRGDVPQGRDETPRAMSQSSDTADIVRGSTDVAGTGR